MRRCTPVRAADHSWKPRTFGKLFQRRSRRDSGISPKRRRGAEMGLFIPGADPGTGGTKEGDNIEFTSAGADRIEQVATQFRTYLTMHVSLNARRRGASAADNTDVDAAYRHLLSRRERPLVVDIFSEAGLVVA